jgi:23S rRNA (adenine-N6)-dimethyltransferase
VPGRRPAAPNPAGAHFLRDAALIARLVRASGAGDGHLVLDLGAGHGAITTALASSGARVIAIERDPRCAARLRRRVAGHPRVTVVEADLREVPLPRRDFLVVASVPFSITTALMRRLAGDPSVPLAGAELITAWGVARWLTAPVPRDAETARWTSRYQMRIAGRVPAASFAPQPQVSAAHLTIRPRPIVASAEGQRLLRRLLRAAYRWPDAPVHHTVRDVVREPAARRRPLGARGARGRPPGAGGRIRGVLPRVGVSPDACAARLTADQWHRLAMLLAGG